MVSLFDKKDRTSQDAMRYGEGDWEYLDRSGRLEAQRVRDFLNEWISKYPDAHRDELIARINSGDNRHFRSATFEVIIYALLKSMGCSITIHPILPSGARPDFLVITPRKKSVYVEAVLASEYSEADIAARRRTDAVLNVIEKMDSPNFFLNVEAEGHPDRPPRGKRLRKNLEQWLASLNPDTVALEVANWGHKAIPKMQWQYEGWSIVFEAIPKKAESRDKGQRVIGSIFEGGRWVNARKSIRDAVRAKGGKYGDLPHPLLVAINVDALSVRIDDDIDGLFGEEAISISSNPSVPPHRYRKWNGAWLVKNGPQFTRVSGTWIFHSLDPWSIVSRVNTVYFNPWANHQLPLLFTTIHHMKIQNEQIQFGEGRSLGEILGLSAEWPR
jgi:hypothetical protein